MPPFGTFFFHQRLLVVEMVGGSIGKRKLRLALAPITSSLLAFAGPLSFPPQSLPRQALDLSESGNRCFPFPKLWFGQEAISYKESEDAGIFWPGPLSMVVFFLDIHLQEDVYLEKQLH